MHDQRVRQDSQTIIQSKKYKCVSTEIQKESRTCASSPIASDKVATLSTKKSTSQSVTNQIATLENELYLNHEVLNYSVERAVFETYGFST